MRRAGELPYGWLADNTRWQRKPQTFDSVEDALNATARFYRKSLWTDAGAYVEIWLEKDALSGVILPITAQYDVPLMVARGYASLSFLHSAAEYIKRLDVPPTSTTSGTTIRLASMPATRSRKPCVSWRRTRKSDSSGSRSSLRKSVNGTSLPGPPNSPIADQRISAISQWNSTQSRRAIFAPL